MIALGTVLLALGIADLVPMGRSRTASFAGRIAVVLAFVTVVGASGGLRGAALAGTATFAAALATAWHAARDGFGSERTAAWALGGSVRSNAC